MMEDKTFAQALEDAQPRITVAVQAIQEVWRANEPVIRQWIATAETLTEQDWLDLPETTRALFTDLKAFMAHYDQERGATQE